MLIVGFLSSIAGLAEGSELTTPMLIGQIEESGAFESSSQMFNLVNKRLMPSIRQNKVSKLSLEVAVMKQILRFLQLLCENHNNKLQNFLRDQQQKTNFNLVSETLVFLDRLCGSTTGGLGLLGLYINESNVALVNQTLETLTEYCQGPCHANQDCIAQHESNGIDIIIALILNDINPLGKKRMDLVLELKNNASKLLLAIMESGSKPENAVRILYNMSPNLLLEVACNAYHQQVVVPTSKTFPSDSSNDLSARNDTCMLRSSVVNPKEVGHNIYILCHQLDILKNFSKDELLFNPGTEMKEALNYYRNHTAQIEVSRRFVCSFELIIFSYIRLFETNRVKRTKPIVQWKRLSSLCHKSANSSPTSRKSILF